MDSKLGYTEGKQDAQIAALSTRVDSLQATVTKQGDDLKRDFHEAIDPIRNAILGADTGKDGLIATVAWHDKMLKWGLSVLSSSTAALLIKSFWR